MPIARRRRKEPSEEVVAEEPDKAKVKKKEELRPGQMRREELLVKLNQLRPALRVGGTLPELEHLWFRDGFVYAYDGGLGIRLSLPSELECGVPGAAFLGVMRTSSLDEIGLEIGKSSIVVKMGRSRTKLNVLPIDREVWGFKDGDQTGTVRLTEAFIESLRSVLVVRATPPQRVEHHGVAVYRDGKYIELYTTDTNTLASASLEDKKSELPEFLFLPRPFAEQLVQLCPEGADLAVGEDYLAAFGEGVDIYSNVLDTEGLIDLGDVAEKNMEDQPDSVPMPTGLEAALDRADVLAGSEGKDFVVLNINGKKCNIEQNYTLGELRESLKLDQEHPETTVAVKTRHLRRALTIADTFSATEDTLVFTMGDSFLYLVGAHEE